MSPALPPSSTPLVGVCDLGGTTLRVALADPEGNLYAKTSAPHTSLDPAEIIERIIQELKDITPPSSRLQGLGISIPGPLDAARGIIHFSPNLGWRNVPLTALLAQRLSLPIALDDDANCAALGEQWLGAGRDSRDFIYLVVGTGIGGGLILDGNIYRGARGGAGEIGHTTIVPDGPLCSCGNRGCLEALAAGPALVRRAAEMGASFDSARALIVAARQNHPIATLVLARAGHNLGIGLANLVNLLNPECIALGGGVALDAGELLLKPALSEMRQRAFPSSVAAVRLTLAHLADNAGLLGAARLILQQIP